MAEQNIGGPTVPRRGRRLTWLAAGYGVLVFFWLSPEDDSVVLVTVLGMGLAILIVLLVTVGRLAGRTFSWQVAILGLMALGGLAGALTGPVTAALMLLKTALHFHAHPDYPLQIIGATLARTPAWSLVGALIGLAIGLVMFALSRRREGAFRG